MDFKEELKLLDNDFATVAIDGTSADTFGVIDTGSYVFNALCSGSIYGGIAGNKVTGLAGEEATGKTFFLLAIIKHFLESDPNAAVYLFESEGAIDKSTLESRGIDLKRVLVVPVETIQEFKTLALRLVSNNLKKPEAQRKKILMALDSLGNLSTTKEMGDSESGKEVKDMTRAGEIRSAFRTLTLRLSKAGIPCIVTNHVYMNVGSFISQKVMSGGGGMKYAASQIVFLSKSKWKEDSSLVGSQIRCTNNKSRKTREGLQVLTRLNHSTGLDRYFGLTDLAIEAGVFKKKTRGLELPDGSTAFEKNIYENPKKYFTKDVLDQIDAYTRATFTYGSPDPDEELEEILNEGTTESGSSTSV